MIGDARAIPTGSTIETDVCVVGSGAAGTTIARELIGEPFQVVVLEAGGARPDRATQSLFEGQADGYWSLDEVRLAGLGGTTRVWAGWCRPLEPSVFLPRPWLSTEGWPFDRAQLDPFYERAQTVCQLGPFDYQVDAWATVAPKLPLRSDLIESAAFQISPTHFGQAYRRDLAESRNVRVLLHAVAAELSSDQSSSRVAALEARTLAGGSFRIEARHFVLATGGLENARLLLASDRDRPGGLGNEHGLVGRRFMEHLYVTSGELELGRAERDLRFYWANEAVCRGERATFRGVLQLPTGRVEAERLLNCAIFVLPAFESGWGMSRRGAQGVKSLAAAWDAGWLPDRIGRDLSAVVGDPVGAIAAAGGRLLRRGAAPKKVSIRAYCEPPPHSDNRVSLTDDRDRLGRRRLRLDWRPAELEWRSIERTHELLDEALKDAGIGRLHWFGSDRRPRPEGGKHHMGTTRMHRDPARGVIDEHGRVHELENLFVTGSSVFPTAGFENPTLTIVALALRLADHVKRLMSGEADRPDPDRVPAASRGGEPRPST